MENITKALIMAASIIMATLLMSILVYMLRAGGNVNKQYDETQLNYQTQKFNYQYDRYQKDDNTVMDMVTLFNLAYTADEELEYNLNHSVIIIVRVGNKTYQFPKDITSTNVDTFFNNNHRALKRNQIYDTTAGVMSVYDLLNKTIGELGISGFGESTDKLAKIHVGEFIYYPDRPAGDPNIGKPAIGENSGTTYKYIFDCDDDKIKYNRSTGRISRMEFDCKVNPNWELRSISSASYPEWD